jgi:hypothetical protein
MEDNQQSGEDVREARDLALAIEFHDTYERLAPSFGYETRPDTKAFDPTTPNGRLMTAVCGELLSRHSDISTVNVDALQDRAAAHAVHSVCNNIMATVLASSAPDGGNNDCAAKLDRIVAKIEQERDGASRSIAEARAALPSTAASVNVDEAKVAALTEAHRVALHHSNYGHIEGNRRAFVIADDLQRRISATLSTKAPLSMEGLEG